MRPPHAPHHRRTVLRRRRTTRGRWQPRWRAGVAAALAVAIVTTACSGDDAGSDLAMSDEAASAEFDGPAAVPSATGGSDGEFADDVDTEEGDAQRPGGSPPLGAPSGDQVVRTAEITLELADTESALREVRQVADRVGGVVATADLSRDRQAGELGGVIVLRVPSPELLGTLDDLEELAVDAPVRRIDERDVSGEVVDLRARVTNLTAYEAELRALLTEVREGSSDADRLLPVFERVNDVRAEIDRLTARRDDLADRVARSTITVTIRPAPGAEPVPATVWAPGNTFDRAAATALSALSTLADGAIWLVVVALPLTVLVLGPVALVARVWWRRHPRAVVTGASPSPTPADS